MLSLAEEKCLQEAPDDEGKLVLDEFEFDFLRANMLLATSMKILGIANVQTGQARCELLASKFKQEYQKLCKPENPFQGGKFFSPTFDTAAALVTNENRVQKTALEPMPYKKKAKKWNHRGYGNTSVLQAAVIQQALAAAQPQMWTQQLPVQQQPNSMPGFLGVAQHYPMQPQPLLHLNPFLHNRRGRGCGHGKGRGRH